MKRRDLLALSGVAAAASFASLAQAQTPPAHWPRSMVLGTAAPGGAFAVYGQALATLISDITKVPTSTQQTQGPNQNLVLVQTRRAQLGMTTMGPAWEALNGELEIARGVRHADLRALFPMYETPFQIVSLQRQGAANITSVAQLAGKTVGVGPRAGTPGTYFPRWFNDLGVNVTIRNGSASDMASQLADGRLDAFAFAAGIPIPAFTELETQTRINFFTFTSEQIDRIIPTNPYVSRFTIPTGTYRTLTEQQVTLAMWNFAFCHRELPEDLAYEIMKGVLENHQRLVTAIRAAETTKAENLVHNTFMPFHPGAVRYYREKGLAVPTQLVPSS